MVHLRGTRTDISLMDVAVQVEGDRVDAGVSLSKHLTYLRSQNSQVLRQQQQQPQEQRPAGGFEQDEYLQQQQQLRRRRQQQQQQHCRAAAGLQRQQQQEQQQQTAVRPPTPTTTTTTTTIEQRLFTPQGGARGTARARALRTEATGVARRERLAVVTANLAPTDLLANNTVARLRNAQNNQV
jgi:hypothetical protein